MFTLQQQFNFSGGTVRKFILRNINPFSFFVPVAWKFATWNKKVWPDY